MKAAINKKALRKSMRQRRRSLSAAQQKSAAKALFHRLICQPVFMRSRHIAFYLANDGEISPRYLLDTALKMGKQCYLPVLSNQKPGYLSFNQYLSSTRLQKNRFGIPEPIVKGNKSIRTQILDLVLVPLVAFDQSGSRLGMGGGYYDRTFAFKGNSVSQKPYLIGIAHACQESPELPLEHWDIPLHAIVTDKKWIACSRLCHRDFLNTGKR